MPTPEAIRARILALVKEYHTAKFAPQSFDPDKDLVHYAGRVFDNEVYINGTGETSRDFCFVENVVQANILAATSENPNAINQVYNIAVSARTTLNQLFEMLRARLEPYFSHLKKYKPTYRDFRLGDIMHSHADRTKAQNLLGYQPTHTIEDGLDVSLEWYKKNLAIDIR